MSVISRLAAFVSRVFPGKFLAGLDRTLASTKIALAVDEYVALSILISIVLCIAVGIIGAFMGLPLPPIVLAPVVGVVAFFALVLFVPRYLSQRRAEELERVLPDALRQMASTLRAGVSVDAALEDISKSNYGELSKEFTRVVNEVSRGRTLESALLALARRSNAPLYERAFNLIVEGIERGAALASVLDSVANDAKEVHVIRRERVTATTQQVMFLFAVALFACPFIIGLTVGVGTTTGGGGGGGKAASGGLPPEMGMIALTYVLIQAFICGLCVGVIKYGKISKGLGYSIVFVIATMVVFSLAQSMVGGMKPS
jgi:flagellar protein FlaJ